MNLARNGKNVPVVITLSRFAQFRRERVIHVEVCGIVIVALADDVDDAALGDFVLEPVKERMTDMRVLEIYSSLDFVFLCGAKEQLQLVAIQGVISTVIGRHTSIVAVSLKKVFFDESFETLF